MRPALFWILEEKIPRHPSVFISIAAVVLGRSRTPTPQSGMLDRQQEAGTLCWSENVTLIQSLYSWAPQHPSLEKKEILG